MHYAGRDRRWGARRLGGGVHLVAVHNVLRPAVVRRVSRAGGARGVQQARQQLQGGTGQGWHSALCKGDHRASLSQAAGAVSLSLGQMRRVGERQKGLPCALGSQGG